jgi:SAM-dependent methyltransferase
MHIPPASEPISYPDDGNDLCFQWEDRSYWFRHRNDCILELVRAFPPRGAIIDVGGGNGFVSRGLIDAGFEAIVVEPGPGADNARRRGLPKVIRGTFAEAGFVRESLAAVGLFDVLEHIDDAPTFLDTLHRHLVPAGRLYCSVPALGLLWSGEDVDAGHFRRYSETTLCAALHDAGFDVEFITHLFSWLVLPVLALRALPFRLGRERSVAARAGDHAVSPALHRVIATVNQAERRRIQRLRPIPLGTSLLAVARRR